MKKEICSSGKNIYYTEQLALDALIDANVQFDFGNRTGPIAFYRCDDCGQFHLTSKGQMNDKLKQMMHDGILAKMKRAADWDKKFKKR